MRRATGTDGQTDLRTMLTGGDRRSLARSARALALIEAQPARVAELARLAMDSDGLVSMRVIAILRRDLRHAQKFVRAWALDSLAVFACTDADLRRVVLRHARAFESSGSKSLATRARRVRERLSRAAASSR